MIRFLSVLFILAGIGFVGWGTFRYLDAQQAGERATAMYEETDAIADSGPSSPSASADYGTSSAYSASDEDTFSTASTRSSSSMMSRLRTVPIAHETPRSARFNRSFE
ncbi:MAG: hypothetical protein WA989_09035, partial [Henriciella sp.]|uniref:hypothetical protein n=1 Tax=Henriciella sp. TaxID=1968823 RepID=UPI003C74DB99